jgi:hypothetical protein
MSRATFLRRYLIPGAICWLSASIGSLNTTPAAGAEPPATAAAQEAPPEKVTTGDNVITLFNGRDFSGWETTGRWTVDQGAIYCDHRYELTHKLIYRASKLPAEFEVRFQFKTKPAAGRRKTLDGAFGLGDGGIGYTDNRVTPPKVEVGFYAHSICYFGGNAFEFYAPERRIPWENRPQPSSLFFFRGPDEDVPEQRGWNDARIVCRGPRIETWVNGRRTVTFDMEKKKETSPEMARPLDEWLTQKSAGLELRIEPGGCRAWYRDITLRSLAD